MKERKRRTQVMKSFMAICLALCMVFGVLPAGLQLVEPAKVQAAAISSQVVENSIAWGLSKRGSHEFDGYCQKFINRCFVNGGYGSVVSFASAKLCGDALITNYSVNNVPRGAVVFFDSLDHGFGHIGISLGDGTMIHAGHKGVEVTRFTDAAYLRTWYRLSYRGWGIWGQSKGNSLAGGSVIPPTNSSIPNGVPRINVCQTASEMNAKGPEVVSWQTTTNWGVFAYVLNPNRAKIGEVGMDLYDNNNNPVGHKGEQYLAAANTQANGYIYYNINSELGVVLQEGTTYKYRLYAYIGGKRYESDLVSFTTKGSATPSTPQLSVTKADYGINEAIQVNWQKYTNASNFQVTVKGVNGTDYNRTIVVNNGNATYSTFTLDKVGEYQVSVVAANASKQSDTAELGTTIKVHPDVTVTFVQEEEGKDITLKTQTIAYGKSATPPASPSKEGHTFQGWSGSYDNVKENIRLTAVYKRNSYQVKFVDMDSEGKETILKTETVLYGDSVTPPEDPKPPKEGYIFGGWSSNDYEYVKGNCTIKASYVWGNINLPVIAKAVECRFEDDVYKVHCTLTNYPDNKTTGRAIVALKTSTGKLLATTESNVFVLGKDETQDLDIIVPFAGAASYAEVVVIDNFSNGTPLSANSRIEVDREWSDWTTEKPAGNVEVESRTEYRTQEKQYTTSGLSSLSGWTLYNTTSAWGNYGGWSGWTTTPLSASDSRQVETKQEAYQVQTGTLYNYSHWVYYSGGKPWYTYSQAYAQARGGWYEERGWGGELFLFTNYNGVWGTANNGTPVWFYERTTPAMETRYRTLYRYRDRSLGQTYHFYKWSDWDEWSPTSAVATDDKKVETRTTYRSKAAMSDIDDKTGKERTISGKVSTEFAGKQATLFVYKHEEASDFNNEYVGQTTIGADGSYTFTFVTKEEPSQVTGDFTADLAIEGATEPIYIDTIKAPKPVYTVEFVDYDGTVLSTQKIEEGGNAELPTNPVREHYEFTGWNTGITNIHDHITIMATYEMVKYTVIYVDWEKQEVSFDKYEEGSELTAPLESVREGYSFKNWLDEKGNVVTKVDRDLVLTAEYQINTYRVRFYDRNGELISDQNVEYGKSALVPEAEEIENMVFAGWGTNGYVNVKCDVNAYATYSYIYTSKMPKASVESGKYEKEFEVSLEAAEGAVIHYTTDGSTPNEQSMIYKGPITISGNTVLRYMALEKNKNASEVGSQVYLITANEDTQGALTIKNNVLDLKVEDDEPTKLSYFLSHSNPEIGIKFYSIDEEIATVDEEGRVNGLHVGTTTVFAITEDFKYASACKVTVTTDVVEVETITLDKQSAAIRTGDTISMAAEVYPKTATYQTVLWFSSNPQVATVDTAGNIEAVEEGIACVTAYSYTGNCYINCTIEVQSSGLSLGKESINLEIGNTHRFQATYDGKDVTDNLTWKSSKPEIAIVENGVVKAVAEGTAVISCMDVNGEFATVIVNVYKVGELPDAPPSDSNIKGDIDGNGKVDLVDTQLALKYALLILNPDEKQMNAADVDGNGIVNFADARKILRAVLKIEQLQSVNLR